MSPAEIAHTPSEANARDRRTDITPTLAPDDTPSKNGSARAFLTRTCTTDPAVVEGRADQGREQHPRHPALPDDGTRYVVIRPAGDLPGDDVPDRNRAQGHRPDPDAQCHGHDQQHTAGAEDQSQRHPLASARPLLRPRQWHDLILRGLGG